MLEQKHTSKELILIIMNSLKNLIWIVTGRFLLLPLYFCSVSCQDFKKCKTYKEVKLSKDLLHNHEDSHSSCAVSLLTPSKHLSATVVSMIYKMIIFFILENKEL